MKKLFTCVLPLLFGLTLVWDYGLSMPPPAAENQSPGSRSEGSSSPTSSDDGGVSMRVLWTVSEYKIGKDAVWGNEEARTMLFKPLDIGKSSITFAGQTCTNIMFKKDIVNAVEYFRGVYDTTPQALGIEGETVEVIKTNCNLPGFAEYLRLQDRRLIIHINGVFFYFSPAVNY